MNRYRPGVIAVVSAWWPFLAFLILGVVCIGAVVTFNVVKAKAFWGDTFEAVGVILFLTSGAWLTRGTWVYRAIGAVVHWQPWTQLVTCGVILGCTIVLFLAALPAWIYSSMSVTMSVGLTGLILPSLLIQLDIHGDWGGWIDDRLTAGVTLLLDATQSAWS